MWCVENKKNVENTRPYDTLTNIFLKYSASANFGFRLNCKNVYAKLNNIKWNNIDFYILSIVIASQTLCLE